MIGASHKLHTHVRSTSSIYEVFQHNLLLLPVIRMQPHPDICTGRVVEQQQLESHLVFHLDHAVCYDWSIPQTSYSCQIYFIHIWCVSATSTAASGHMGAIPAWYMLGLTVTVTVVVVDWSIILISDLLYTYMKCFDTFYFGSWLYGCNPSMISALERGTVVMLVGHSLGFDMGCKCYIWLRPSTHFLLILYKYKVYQQVLLRLLW
jgi:hypothetical protein